MAELRLIRENPEKILRGSREAAAADRKKGEGKLTGRNGRPAACCARAAG